MTVQCSAGRFCRDLVRSVRIRWDYPGVGPAATVLAGILMLTGCATGPLARKEVPSRAAEVVPVRVWTETITLPTYSVRRDAVPRFQATDWVKFYPYPAQWDIAAKPKPQEWTAVCLENEYVKVVVLPELGGRLFALYDKLGQFDAIYRQKSIKPARVGIRGAWICGGIEYNFPDSHSVTTHDKVHWTTRRYPDGSAAILIGDVERISRMAWTVEFRLRPGRASLEDHIFLHNRTPIRQRYFYWTNAAVEASDQTQVVLPFPKVTGHSGRRLLDWPIRNGEDFSWYRKYPRATSTFGVGGGEGFIGAYDHAKGVGIVHYADHDSLPGRKFWTWGTSPAGRRWATVLSDDNRPYIELQAGPLLTQSEYVWLPPAETRRYSEYWIPVRRIGPFQRANPDAVVRLTVEQGEATVGVLAVRAFRAARIELYAADKLLKSWKTDLAPQTPFLAAVPVGSTEARALRLVVRDAHGKVIIEHVEGQYLRDEKAIKSLRAVRGKDTDPSSPAGAVARYEQQWLHARYSSAARTIEKALAEWPDDPQVRLAAARFRLRQALPEQAIGLLKPLSERPDDVGRQARYYLAVAYLQAGNARAASNALLAEGKDFAGKQDDASNAARDGISRRAQRMLLAKASLAAGQFDEALEKLRPVLQAEPDYSYAAALAACAARRSGRRDLALQIVGEYLNQPDLEPMARLEWQLATGQADPTLQRILLRDSDASIELACDYIAIGDWGTAEAVLLGLLGENIKSGMTWLMAGWCAEVLGQPGQAAQFRRRAEAMPVRMVFPSRPEELAAAERALQAGANASRAAYYAGLVLMHLHRYDEAIEMWQRAIAARDDNGFARRCLGIALARIKHKPQDALAHLEQAVRLEPTEPSFYIDLADLYADLDQPEDELAVLVRGAKHAPANDALVHRLAVAHLGLGQWRQATEVLASHQFNVAEGRYELHDHYAAAWLGAGLEALVAGNPTDALEAFDRALEYPENLAIGRPAEPNDEAMIHFWRSVTLGLLNRPQQARKAMQAAAAQKVSRWMLRADRYYPILNAVHNALALKWLGQNEKFEAERKRLRTSIPRRSRRHSGGTAESWNHFRSAWLDILKGSGEQDPPAAETFEKDSHVPRMWRALAALAARALQQHGKALRADAGSPEHGE